MVGTTNLQNVRFSNDSGIQMSGFQIPTVVRISDLDCMWIPTVLMITWWSFAQDKNSVLLTTAKSETRKNSFLQNVEKNVNLLLKQKWAIEWGQLRKLFRSSSVKSELGTSLVFKSWGSVWSQNCLFTEWDLNTRNKQLRSFNDHWKQLFICMTLRIFCRIIRGV